MLIEMLGGYVVEIKVKKIDKKRFSAHETKHFLNRLRIVLDDANEYCKLKNDTYYGRIATGISKAIYTELKNAGYYNEGR